MLGLRQAGLVHVSDDLVRSATGLAGGGGDSREMCGALIAGIQALGLRYGRVDRTVDRRPALAHSAGLITAFKGRFGAVSCGELIRGFPDVTSRERKAHCAGIVAFVAEWLELALAAGHPGR
ncbi:MAG: C-GCAxxG-C-C family protein [Micromonosporaceae bacterium]